MNDALQALEVKVENGGATPQGKVFAKEWNVLVEAVKALDLKEFDEAALHKFLQDNGYITEDNIPTTDLSGVVTLATEQAISGRKNFVGGVEVNGQELVYDAEKKVWQLTGDLIVTGAVTMFSSLSGFTPSTVMNAVLVDNETIIKVKDAQGNWVLRAPGGGGSGGTGGTGGGLTAAEVNALIEAALVPYALKTAIPTDNNQLSNSAGYITASALTGYASEEWVSNQGYAKQSALTAVDNRLTAVEVFFATEDSDTLINKWAEIVAFLNATEGDTLDNILKTKANQSALDDAVASLTTEIGKKWTQNDAKIANWDAAYGWGNHANAGYAAKTYVDGELAKYVKLAVAQSIEAQHNFVNGLKIGGLGITKSQDDVVYIDANLVVRGAVTMFGSGATIAPSIWASIPFDDTMEWNGSEWSVVDDGSGSVNEATVNNLIYEYLTQNNYAKISDISSALTGYATQSWVGNNYLSLSGGAISSLTIGRGTNSYETLLLNTSTGVGFLIYEGGVNWKVSDANWSNSYSIIHSGNYTDYFTKANIKSTLGISDWALAATKPSYTAAEVGALSTSGGALSGYITIGAFTAFGVSGGNFYLGSPEYPLLLRHSGTATINGNTIIHSGNIGSYKAGSADVVVINYSQSDTNYNLLFTNQADQWVAKVDAVYRDNRNKLFYNPSTGALTATSFVGNLTGNAGSATKLQTARTIWGRSFDGTGNVVGALSSVSYLTFIDTESGIYQGNRFSGAMTKDGVLISGDLISLFGGNVAIGGTTADAKLHVHGDAKIGGVLNITSNNTTAIVLTDSSRQESSIAFKGTGGNEWYVGKGVGSINDFFGIYNAYKGNALVIDNNSDVTIYGNLLTTGIITTPQINIGGLAAYKLQDDTLFIDANVVVRGAISMFGVNTLAEMESIEQRLLSLEQKVEQLSA